MITLGPILLTMPWWRATPLGARDRRRLGMALAGGVAPLLGWALTAAHLGGPDYAHMLLWGQSVERLHASMAHARPLLWYLPWLALLLFPWSLWPRAWPRLPRSRHQRLAWFWTLIPFAIFSLISGKQIHYLMPLLPAVALMIADRLGYATRANHGRLLALATPILLLGVLGLVVAFTGADQLPAASLSAPGALTLIGWGALVWRWRPASLNQATHAVALASSVAVLLTTQMMLAPLWQRYDIDKPSELIHRLQLEGVDVGFDGSHYPATFQFAGRLTQPLVELTSPRAICEFQRQHPDAWLVGRERDWNAIKLDAPAVHAFDYRGGRLGVFPLTALPRAERDRLCGAPTASTNDASRHSLADDQRNTP